MSTKDAEHVKKYCADQNIKFIRLCFTDILGFLKGFAITIEELDAALNDGLGFDGSSIEGFARIEESDMIAMPDPETFVIVPRVKQRQPIASMFCDILTPDGNHYEGDPRWSLKRILQRASDLGFTYYVGPELEYFYFKNSESASILDKGGYFDLTPHDLGSNMRKETIVALQKMGIKVEYSHHEVAPSQHEIDLRYTDALTMADHTMTYRLMVKEVAQANNCYATFMPKPIKGENGSGMHTHQSLFREDKNAFFAPNNDYHLSVTGQRFLAGLLKHAREITAVTNQWINSYKRLVPGYEAPAYISWGCRNRSALVRVPEYKPSREKATRLEFRSPDPACNPYLAFSVMLAAGLKGIEKEYEAPDPVELDIYQLSEEKLQELKIGTLPGNLFEAIQAVERSELVRDSLGDHIFDKFVDNKRIEWNAYRMHVSDFEIDRYLSVL